MEPHLGPSKMDFWRLNLLEDRVLAGMRTYQSIKMPFQMAISREKKFYRVTISLFGVQCNEGNVEGYVAGGRVLKKKCVVNF